MLILRAMKQIVRGEGGLLVRLADRSDNTSRFIKLEHIVTIGISRKALSKMLSRVPVTRTKRLRAQLRTEYVKNIFL
jgi:hypothetical protein